MLIRSYSPVIRSKGTFSMRTFEWLRNLSSAIAPTAGSGSAPVTSSSAPASFATRFPVPHPIHGPMLQVITTARDPQVDVASLRMAASGQPIGEDDFLRGPGRFDAEGGESLKIKVDSVDVDVTVWRDGDRWWTAGQHHERGLVLQGCCFEVDDLALERVYDLEPYVAGRRAHLRALRGEA